MITVLVKDIFTDILLFKPYNTNASHSLATSTMGFSTTYSKSLKSVLKTSVSAVMQIHTSPNTTLYPTLETK